MTQVVVELREERGVAFHRRHLLQREPGGKESGDQDSALAIGQHPPDVCLQRRGISQPAVVSAVLEIGQRRASRSDLEPVGGPRLWQLNCSL